MSFVNNINYVGYLSSFMNRLNHLFFVSEKFGICCYIRMEKQNYKNENIERKYLNINQNVLEL